MDLQAKLASQSVSLDEAQRIARFIQQLQSTLDAPHQP